MKKNNVVHFQEKYEQIELSKELWPGFSHRLNRFIDISQIDSPSIDSGRQAYIAKIVQASRWAAGEWLKNDALPKPTTLRKLVELLTVNIPGEFTVERVEAWLKYGDGVVPDPFAQLDNYDANNYQLISMQVISDICKSKGIEPAGFNLQKAINKTNRYLHAMDIHKAASLTKTHKHQIQDYIIEAQNN